MKINCRLHLEFDANGNLVTRRFADAEIGQLFVAYRGKPTADDEKVAFAFGALRQKISNTQSQDMVLSIVEVAPDAPVILATAE